MTKRAVLIGINYTGTDCELRGCCNDIADVAKCLLDMGFDKSAFAVLTDAECGYPAVMPTRRNIIDALDHHVKLSKPGDTLYVHYSGHGSQVEDTNGDELDGEDECICPLDYDDAGMLIDDDLNIILVKNLAAGVKLRVVFDSCHSGSCLDLPLRYDLSKIYSENHNVMDRDVVFISGCRDNQTSADSSFGGRSNGALTWAFLTALKLRNKVKTWKDLCMQMRSLLRKGGYDQVPQLDSMQSAQFTAAVDL